MRQRYQAQHITAPASDGQQNQILPSHTVTLFSGLFKSWHLQRTTQDNRTQKITKRLYGSTIITARSIFDLGYIYGVQYLPNTTEQIMLCFSKHMPMYTPLYIYFDWHLSHSQKNVLHQCQKNNETKRKSIHLGLLIADC